MRDESKPLINVKVEFENWVIILLLASLEFQKLRNSSQRKKVKSFSHDFLPKNLRFSIETLMEGIKPKNAQNKEIENQEKARRAHFGIIFRQSEVETKAEINFCQSDFSYTNVNLVWDPEGRNQTAASERIEI